MQNTYKYCPYCGRKFPIFMSSEKKFCCFCGKQLKKLEKSQKKRVQCTICHKEINHDRNQIIVCSFCGSIYHSSCIFPWLVKFNSCPMCQNVFLNPNLIQRSNI
jgi:hypothetical protein